MEEDVQKELKTLRGMVLAWKESHLRCAPSQGGEFLVTDFLEEIETQVYPYVRRMHDCDYLTQSEAKEFLDFCYDQVDNLRDSLREAEAEQPDTKGG